MDYHAPAERPLRRLIAHDKPITAKRKEWLAEHELTVGRSLTWQGAGYPDQSHAGQALGCPQMHANSLVILESVDGTRSKLDPRIETVRRQRERF